MTLKELYALKGEYQTAIEINQAKLKNINEQLIRSLSNPNNGEDKPENKDNKATAEVVKPESN